MTLTIKAIREGRHIYWDPSLKYSPPQSGWFKFYLSFEVCWMDWILAGYCSKKACLVSIDNGIFDVTKFQREHPGSFETLNDAGGCDATDLFLEAGHSGKALRLLGKFCIWDPFLNFLNKFQSINSNASSSNNLLEDFADTNEFDLPQDEEENQEDFNNNDDEVIEEELSDLEPPVEPPFLCYGCFSLTPGSRKIPVCSPLFSHYKATQNRIVEIANEYLKPKTDDEKGLDSFFSQIKVLSSFSSLGEAKTESQINNSNSSQGDNNSPTKSESLIGTVMNIGGTIRRYSFTMKEFNEDIDDENAIPYTETDALFDSLEQFPEPFGPQKILIPHLNGYFQCKASKYSVFVEHVGQARAFFDPLSREWIVWWTCCGKSQVLEETKLITHDSQGKVRLDNFLPFVFSPGI